MQGRWREGCRGDDKGAFQRVRQPVHNSAGTLRECLYCRLSQRGRTGPDSSVLPAGLCQIHRRETGSAIFVVGPIVPITVQTEMGIGILRIQSEGAAMVFKSFIQSALLIIQIAEIEFGQRVGRNLLSSEGPFAIRARWNVASVAVTRAGFQPIDFAAEYACLSPAHRVSSGRCDSASMKSRRSSRNE